MKKIAVILTVDAIEPSLKFWEEKLGYTRAAEVPGENGLVFAMLQKDGTELMFQTHASVRDDIPKVASRLASNKSLLYIDVESLDSILPALEGLEVLVPRRTTFYGADEIGVVEPGGHMVIFAEHKESKEDAKGD